VQKRDKYGAALDVSSAIGEYQIEMTLSRAVL
jgi:hypothetical protein